MSVTLATSLRIVPSGRDTLPETPTMITTTKPAGTRGYAYVRVSKDVQDARSQRDAIQTWLTPRSLEVLDTYQDAGSRDLAHKRPNFQALLAAVQAGKVDWIVVAERDRFGVADNEEWGYFVTILRRHNCQLWSVADDKELTSRKDRVEPFMAAITSDRSRSEQEARGQREHRSKHALVQRGHWPGGKPPYGYDLVCRDEAGGELWRLVYEPGQYKRICHYPDGTTKRFDGKNNIPSRNKGEVLVPEPTHDSALLGRVGDLFRLFSEGWTARRIAGQLNQWKVPSTYKGMWLGPTVAGILRNPIYVLGVPVWNKAAHGRFVQFVNGEWVAVERDGGRVKAGRKRTEKDHVKGVSKLANAIIDTATWNAVQDRIRAGAANPKKERRPRNAALYFANLITCGDCGEPMTGWGQHMSYRCSTNMHDTHVCRCNRTRHDIVEELVMLYLDQTHGTLEFLSSNPDHCLEVMELERQSEPLAAEYVKKVTQMWRAARAGGAVPPEDEKTGLRVWTYEKLKALAKPGRKKLAADLTGQIEAKEEEKTRLAKRLGLVDDEAAEAVAARIKEVATELRELRENAKPAAGAADTLREQLKAILNQTRQVRELMETALPLQKGEYVRRVISRIVVRHVPKKMGKLKASRMVEVEIVPAVGQSRAYRDGKHFDADAEPQVLDWDNSECRPTPNRKTWLKEQRELAGTPACFTDETLRARG